MGTRRLAHNGSPTESLDRLHQRGRPSLGRASLGAELVGRADRRVASLHTVRPGRLLRGRAVGNGVATVPPRRVPDHFG